MKGILIGLATLTLAGCATTSQNIQSTYVSPMTYDSYDCTQLSLEADRISRRVSELTGQIDKRASGDKTQTAVALVLFWPAVFFLGNNEAQNAELSKLKGESEALQQASITKDCSTSTTSSTVTQEQTAPAQDTYAQLEKLAKLRDDGILTDEEFQIEKTKLLSGDSEATQ
jgi:uncharacterized lipoprotein YajG